ncbi:MAG: hypothetical protein J6D07_04350, partial [Mogibacterium sp.]|nr:hypothetical protein [Mogibacterium sp.]
MSVNYRNIVKLILLIVAVIITQTSCKTASPEPVSKEEFLLDTICSISIYEIKDGDGNVAAQKNKDKAEKIIDDAFELCRKLESTLSRTKADSDVGRINS